MCALLSAALSAVSGSGRLGSELLASHAFGTRAAGVAGVYGAVMLLAGTLTATLLRHRPKLRCTA